MTPATYLLIFVLQTSNNYPIAAGSAEFNSLTSCRAAASELQKQLTETRVLVKAIMCAKKG